MNKIELGAELEKFSELAMLSSLLLFIASIFEGDATLKFLLASTSYLDLLEGWVLYRMANRIHAERLCRSQRDSYNK
ncbi:hypothetical protein [Thermofilum sp.]|jgi:hypothetical protein|uniref:hypothetical protein n=1 Tax=Thermofilum sp. TaxID=1961369 RepID=UPI0025878A1F|nr:hypothetical protein [Thermofilum sp.]